MSDTEKLIQSAELLLGRIERLLPAEVLPTDWDGSIAFRWRKRNGRGVVEAVRHVHDIRLDQLHGIDHQKQTVEQNTRQFVAGHPANNVLLTGARGTGKSSLIKALLNRYAAHGLRLIEVEKHDLIDLPEIVDHIDRRHERFVLFCDDLSFDADEPGFKALKVVLDGSIAAASENCLIYATSNRRHLMPEYMSENLAARHVDDEIHPEETVEEKISLSERFGVWVSFYPFDQDEYLNIVEQWLTRFAVAGADTTIVRQAALQWALQRGSRSGRVAWQFARDWAGRLKAGTDERVPTEIREISTQMKFYAVERNEQGRTKIALGAFTMTSPINPACALFSRRIEVVAAVIFNERGEFLLAQRPPHKIYGGYWEFPGGKVEANESAPAALARELHEELGIEVMGAYPWLTRDFDYAHAAVRLHFFRVQRWSGDLHGKEQQQIAWQTVRNPTVAPVLPANGPILRALDLPHAYGITCAGALGRERFMTRVEQSLRDGLRLIQVREKHLTDHGLRAFVKEVVAASRPFGARVIVNGPAAIAAQCGAHGIHLTASQLMTATRRPEVEWCGASCHDAAELARARELGLDFVALGAVKATPSHPHAVPVGWTHLAHLIRDYPLPVYALGGMQASDLEQAWCCGAHGIAMMRGAWGL